MSVPQSIYIVGKPEDLEDPRLRGLWTQLASFEGDLQKISQVQDLPQTLPNLCFIFFLHQPSWTPKSLQAILDNADTKKVALVVNDLPQIWKAHESKFDEVVFVGSAFEESLFKHIQASGHGENFRVWTPENERLHDPILDPVVEGSDSFDMTGISQGGKNIELEINHAIPVESEPELAVEMSVHQKISGHNTPETIELSKLRELYTDSEKNRRKLQALADSLEVDLRAAENDRERLQKDLEDKDGLHQNQLKEYQIKLNNLQYQHLRAEKKYEDLQEKIRGDILKIRLREKELYNKLELQKRDAEALLVAKDERLLDQKRDIDRLTFEIENLRERAMDETRRAEERSARLHRANQSLKMALGVLEGMGEEVLPRTHESDEYVESKGKGRGQGEDAA